MIDEGQGKVMISLSIIDRMNPEADAQKFKSSGVKKIFVLATAPCKESYDNAKYMTRNTRNSSWVWSNIGMFHCIIFHYSLLLMKCLPSARFIFLS